MHFNFQILHFQRKPFVSFPVYDLFRKKKNDNFINSDNISKLITLSDNTASKFVHNAWIELISSKAVNQ